MKKILFAIAIVMTMGFCAKAQDGFIRGNNDVRFEEDGTTLELPYQHNLNNDQPGAPLGSGLLILTALGAGYAMRKRNK